MQEIHMGQIILKHRKTKGVTQDELAKFIGVSKAAISKWESAHSYPDITLLPILATYFNISIDELVGYEPQMEKEDIKKLYQKLIREFATKPFHMVYDQCIEYEKKYYSCWELQWHIGLLLVNHCNLVEQPEKMQEVVKEAQTIFQRIAENSVDVSMAKRSVQMEALTHLILGELVESIDLLEGLLDMSLSTEVLLSQAYQARGDFKKARSILQGFVYQNLIGMLDALPKLISLYPEDKGKREDCFQKIEQIAEIFQVSKFQPTTLLNAYFLSCQMYCLEGDKKSALDMLEKYVCVCCSESIFPLKIQSNTFFDQLDDYMNEMDLPTVIPRDETVVKRSLIESVEQFPGFGILHEEKKYQQLIRKLKQI